MLPSRLFGMHVEHALQLVFQNRWTLRENDEDVVARVGEGGSGREAVWLEAPDRESSC